MDKQVVSLTKMDKVPEKCIHPKIKSFPHLLHFCSVVYWE